jgi:hypothetical protein
MGEGFLLDSGMIIFRTTFQPWKFQIFHPAKYFKKHIFLE